MPTPDGAAIIGAGPNGLAAAVTLARAGIPVTVFEASNTIGGGTRTTETAAPGILQDVCSAIHPLALATGFFGAFQLTSRMNFAVPDASYANPLDNFRSGGRAAVAYRDLVRTTDELGCDGRAYQAFYQPLLNRLDGVIDFALGGSMLRLPTSPVASVMTAMRTFEQGTKLWNLRFREEAAPALISGVAAHSIGRMPNLATSAVGVVLGALGHATGWPVPLGGSRTITDVLAQDLLEHGGHIKVLHPINDVRELSDFRVKLFNTSAGALERIAGSVLPRRYLRALARFKYGDGACKVDFVLDGPIPWQDSRVNETPTVHLGGTRAEGAAAELHVSRGHHPERPYVLLAQPTKWDPSRNRSGIHAVWSYTHVPAGSTVDMGERVITQIERFAPGFRDRIISHHVTTAAELGNYNSNYHGGDFSAGKVNMRQLLARPVLTSDPWRTPAQGIYLCSSSTSPGPGVHGLSGWYAARSALTHEFGLPSPELGITP